MSGNISYWQSYGTCMSNNALAILLSCVSDATDSVKESRRPAETLQVTGSRTTGSSATAGASPTGGNPAVAARCYTQPNSYINYRGQRGQDRHS